MGKELLDKCKVHGRPINSVLCANQGASEFMGKARVQAPDNNPFASAKQRRFMFSKHPK